MYFYFWFSQLLVVCAIVMSGCVHIPTSGPSALKVTNTRTHLGTNAVQVVNVDDQVTRQLLALRKQRLFSETLGNDVTEPLNVGSGDVLEVSIWEAVPATLFGNGMPDLRGMVGASHATVFSEQVVSHSGTINIPFAGSIIASNRSLEQIEQEITQRLQDKANQPQVLVKMIRNASTNVTVIGEVGSSGRVPLTPHGERLLDALAAVGGVRQTVNKITIQVTRGGNVYSMPLDRVIRDPNQNIPLLAGDVITALFQPLSFTALGATGKNEEVNFEAQGITLAQALARAGGLVDFRANAQGVFIFRLEQKSALAWPNQPILVTPEGQVPVVYRVDLNNPSSFFIMQSFPIQNRDVVYVANSPMAELQKFLNVVFSVAYPVLNTIQVTK
ncbi:polysaccharide biosynthesis/export family protein [Candidatus Symbiobacter mobilis]|uniref:Polysaccharide exporter n=1 Tax=Candidatus Symbiobacter mobilis CR TaxID=946483 RepID=U5NDR4_9BURK|nr:polysaccharide biosynthesis/export family protein [Candidatus Symbiobacter mobilis]AGX88343.1 polysaccharide exporter [Candidatus Symbiobacter mobilis CR]